MKKVIAILQVLILSLSLCSCQGESVPAENSEPSTQSQEVAESEEATEEEEEAAKKEEELETEKNELSQIGEVEVENGIVFVKLTVPKDLVGETTQQQLDENAKGRYTSASLNEDGSVTYKMTKAEHREMLKGLKESFADSMKELVNDKENYSMASVEYNQDFTEFDVTMDSDTLGFGDSFSCIIFSMYGEMYGIFSGNTPEKVVVHYYDPDGNEIETFDSSEAQE